MAFMSMRLLNACQGKRTTIHTALDDLESFLWLLIWGIVYASKDIDGAKTANEGIELMLIAWSGDAKSNLNKLAAAERSWEDVVFGGLIKEWLGIFTRASDDTWKFMKHLPTIPLDDQLGSEWRRACDWLESYCMKTYEAVLKSGFKHLEEVRRYSNWEEVVVANSQVQPMEY
jgi:hypothetical protein